METLWEVAPRLLQSLEGAVASGCADAVEFSLQDKERWHSLGVRVEGCALGLEQLGCQKSWVQAEGLQTARSQTHWELWFMLLKGR